MASPFYLVVLGTRKQRVHVWVFSVDCRQIQGLQFGSSSFKKLLCAIFPHLLAAFESGIGLVPYDTPPSLCPHPPAWGGPGHRGGQEAALCPPESCRGSLHGHTPDFKTTLRSCFAAEGAWCPADPRDNVSLFVCGHW